MRGYFGIGVEGLHKPMNLGNLLRTAHGFGASFVFTVAAHARIRAPGSDTSKTYANVPLYHFDHIDALALPVGCALVGIELTDDAIDLPSFRHPRNAAYILGAEMFGLSAATLERCDFVIKIPTKFSLNVATAGAIAMYDRVQTLGQFPPRPVRVGGPTEPATGGQPTGPRVRQRARNRRAAGGKQEESA
ncbi:MAG: RNA methyltransferase [Alphaproteobacteria bacterium]|nr:MAG: RNA methyltransferase [Alphaproteobacteria bacterium]